MAWTIVVADDSADYRLVVRTLLEPLADTVRVVGEGTDGEEALAVIRRERPDIVITDLVMPGLNGIELTKCLRRELPRTRIILMSSFTEDAYRVRASESGADAFVHKHVISSALLPAIHDVMRRVGGGSHSPSRPGPDPCPPGQESVVG